MSRISSPILRGSVFGTLLLMGLGCDLDSGLPGTPATAPNSSADAASGEGSEASAVAQVNMQTERASLLAAVASYSTLGAQQNILTVYTTMLATDVRYLEFTEPILFGRTAVLQFIQSDPATAAAAQTWHPVRVDVSADGLRGYTYGYTAATGAFGAGGTIVTLDGKFIAFWRKESDGTWDAIAYVQNFQRTIVVADPPPGFESPSYVHYRYFPNTDPAAERTLLMATDDAFAARALVVGPGEAFFEYAAEDAAVLSGRPSILYGRDVIKSTFATFPSNGQLLWHAVDGDVAPSGDLGFTVGESETHTFPGGVPTVTYSKYVTVWKRQKTGEWLFEVDGGNARPAP